MKKFLFRLLIFIVTACITQYVVYISIKYCLDKKSNFRVTRYFRNKHHRYFVLGNSKAVNSIDEKYANEKLKLDCINMAFNGLLYEHVLDMLDDVNANNKNAVIFMEVSCLYDDAQQEKSFAYYIGNSKFISRHYTGSVYDRIPLIRLDNEIFLRNIYYLFKSDNEWINTNVIAQNVIDAVKSDTLTDLIHDQKELESRIADISKKCDSNNNKIIFFAAPLFPSYLAKIRDYHKMVNTFKGHNFIDLNSVKLSQNMFADRYHTNINGAILLTNYLLSLSKKYLTPK